MRSEGGRDSQRILETEVLPVWSTGVSGRGREGLRGALAREGLHNVHPILLKACRGLEII